MKNNFYKLTTVYLFVLSLLTLFTSQAYGQRHMENLGRGVVAVRTSPSEVYIGWRMLATDPGDIRFNVYFNGTTLVNANGGSTIQTNITHSNTSTVSTDYYIVKPVIGGVEQEASAPATVWSTTSLRVQLQRPAGGTTPAGENYTYSPSDSSVGDLDGDGEYEIIVKWEPSNAKDNSQQGYTGNVYLDAYKLNGTHLWRIDLGRNIRAGAHYTQFIVYDLDSDGIAEIACKTAPNTKDGTGKFLSVGPAVNDNDDADYRTGGTWAGFISTGPEYLTIFNGRTGAEMATTLYAPDRNPITGWGSTREGTNRVDRFLAGVGYFDGERPSLLMCRGYYGRSVLVAWDWRNGQLTQRWLFDSNASGNSGYGGQGYHSLSINDVDGDGKDEVVYGSMVLDHDGKGLYTTRLGHGDALHVSDMDPDRPGLEVWTCQESPSEYAGLGLRLRDARTGANIFGVPATDDVGRALAADIDPNHKGMELWGSRGGLYNVKGEQIGTAKPSINFAVWWDADLQREMLDGNQVRKWNPASNNTSVILDMAGHSSNNSTKSTPNLSADILGDWREEVIMRSTDNTSLRIFTTPTPYYSNTTTNPRFYTLMHDPQYRISISWQNVAYNQPPHTSFYLGGGMDMEVPRPNILLVGSNVTSSKKEVDKLGNQANYIYPNPSSSAFKVNATGAYTYTIYDQLGRAIEKGAGSDSSLIGSNLAAGVYMVKIVTRNGVKTERVFKH